MKLYEEKLISPCQLSTLTVQFEDPYVPFMIELYETGPYVDSVSSDIVQSASVVDYTDSSHQQNFRNFEEGSVCYESMYYVDLILGIIYDAFV